MIKLTSKQTMIFGDGCTRRVAAAGRRGGKTVLQLAVAMSVCSKIPNARVCLILPTIGQTKKVLLPLVAKFIEDRFILNHNKTDRVITLPRGSQIFYEGGDSYDRLRGREFDHVGIDETADIADNVFNEVIEPTLITTDGTCLMTGTPKGKNNDFYRFSQLAYKNDNWSFHTYTTLQGGLVPADKIQDAKTRLDERTFKQEYEASFETSSGVAYYAYGEHNHANREFDPHLTTYLCWDFDVNESPMSCIVNQDHNGKRYAVKEFIHKYSNTQSTAESVERWLRAKNFNGRLIITGDYYGKRASSNASQSDYEIICYILRGYNLDGIPHVSPTRRITDRVAATNSSFKPMAGDIRQFVNIKQCPKLDEDLRLVEFLSNGKLDKRNNGRTHASDALSYDHYNHFPIRSKSEIIIR